MNMSGGMEEKAQFGVERILGRDFFLHLLDLEMKRARRYQNFVSLLLLRVSPLSGESPMNLSGCCAKLKEILADEMRETDLIGAFTQDKMVALMPYASECSGNKAKGRIERMLKFCDFEREGCQIAIQAICFPANVTNIADLLRIFQQPLA